MAQSDGTVSSNEVFGRKFDLAAPVCYSKSTRQQTLRRGVVRHRALDESSFSSRAHFFLYT